MQSALGIWREALRGFGSASGEFGGRGGLYDGCGDSCVKAGSIGDDKALCLLCLGLLEGAVLWVPSDKEFFHKSGILVVFDATGVHRSRTRLMPALSPLPSLPRRGSVVARALRFRSAFRLSTFLLRGDEKWSVILDVGTALPFVGSLGWRVSALLIECCRVALSNVRGDGVFGMVV